MNLLEQKIKTAKEPVSARGFMIIETITLAIIATRVSILFVLVILLMMGIHEFGHYLVAKYEGTFEKFVFHNGNFGVKRTDKHRHRLAYLAGLGAEFFGFPLYLTIMSPNGSWGVLSHIPTFQIRWLLILGLMFLGARHDLSQMKNWKKCDEHAKGKTCLQIIAEGSCKKEECHLFKRGS